MTDSEDRRARASSAAPKEPAAKPGRASFPRKLPRCPICSQPVVQQFRPFCSQRCADVDLGRWLGEHYRMPGEPPGAPSPEDEDG